MRQRKKGRERVCTQSLIARTDRDARSRDKNTGGAYVVSFSAPALDRANAARTSADGPLLLFLFPLPKSASQWANSPQNGLYTVNPGMQYDPSAQDISSWAFNGDDGMNGMMGGYQAEDYADDMIEWVKACPTMNSG